MKKYDHQEIEAKWQKEWAKKGIYKTGEGNGKPKCYVLDMFPYPSGDGLHVGHPKGYIATDVYSRFKKMNGFNILHPMGWDAFGLPAENYAIKNKVHPRVAVEKNIARFKEQLGKIGFNYDWSREINTTDPEYYKWTQWIFLKLLEKGLAYESNEPVNWCPSCQTVLSNEDLENGKCERCGSVVEKKPMRQWVLRITDYADRLLNDLDATDYEMPKLVDKVNPHREGAPIVHRKVAHAIVFDPKAKKYLIIRNKKHGWDTVIIGGIEGKESAVETAKREVREETGYIDLEFKRLLGGPTEASYYTKHKGENRVATAQAVYFELKSEERVSIADGEDKDDEILWIGEEDFVPGKMVNSELHIWLERLKDPKKGWGEALLNWPESIKESQRNWIGRSEGTEIEFKISPTPAPLPEGEGEMPNYLILHGYTGRADKNFIPWLKKSLEEKGFKVQAPQLPDTDNPKESEQVDYVIKNCQIDGNTIIVGHSLGAVVAMKLLQKINKPIAGLVLIAAAMEPSFKFKDAEERPFWKTFSWDDIDYEKLKKLAGSRVVISDLQEDEKENGRTKYLEHLSQKLGANLIKGNANRIHFCAEEEPVIFNSLISEFKPSPLGREGWGYETADPKAYQALQEKALEIRQSPTKAEDLLWQELRGHSTGCHFRRQHIIGKFIVDFVCLEKKLAVEVDGDIHDYQREADAERTTFLEQNGFKVVRFKNEEVEKDIESVKIKINQQLKTLSFGEGLGGASIKVFTTRADTLFGVTYVVLAPEHPLIRNLKLDIKNWSEVEKYLEQVENKTEIERTAEGKEKTGVQLEGVMAANPANGEQVPVWVADYVLANYGTGAVMAVPAHDERDRQFAEKYKLPIVDRPLVSIDEAVEKAGGKKTVKYKLRDWVFSRQRYWGEPIPVIHCPKDGVVPVPEKDLPVRLPEVESYEPTGTGESPLANIAEWVNVPCPKCGGPAKRETNTMPQWAGSSWYYLRYCDPQNSEELASKEKTNYWLGCRLPDSNTKCLGGVDFYVGGAEHATRHLIYARFWHKFLFDIGVVKHPEPFTRLQNVGLIMSEDGRKMSKRYGNVINPDDIVKLYGADTLRVYEMFMGPFDQAIAWSTESMMGPRRFLERVWKLGSETRPNDCSVGRAISRPFENHSLISLIHQTIKKVGEDIEAMRFNTAISSLMILVNTLEAASAGGSGVPKADLEILLQLLAPFAPHITEELWRELGHTDSIHLSSWPKYEASELEQKEWIIVVQVNGVKREMLTVATGTIQAEVEKMAQNMPQIAKWLAGQSVKKVIYVPGRLLNFVV